MPELELLPDDLAATAEFEVDRKNNARESISLINDELWASGGGDFSSHVTIIHTSPAKRLLSLLKLHSPVLRKETTRGFVVFNAYEDVGETGNTFKTVVITPDNKFATEALPTSMTASSHRNSRTETIHGQEDGENSEGSIFISRSTLKPLSELPEPEQVLGRFMLNVNDRMSRSLDWHIERDNNNRVQIKPGRIVYL